MNRTDSLIDQLIKVITEKVSNEVVSKIRPLLEEHCIKGVDNTILVDSKKLCELLSISKSHLVQLRKQNLPTVMLNTAVRYDVDSVKSFIKNLNTNKNETQKS